ncbi:MAG: EamA family transporter [Gammaproteobacteria bacterium]
MATASLRLKIGLAFLTVYLVWGSTYLAIRIGVADLPPALFAGARFIASGVAIGIYARYRGIAFPDSWREWKLITVVGVLLLVGANGLVVWGEQWVPSNQAALIIATTALWIAGIGTLGPRGEALTRQTMLGLAVGFVGVAVLMFPHGQELSISHMAGQLAIMLSALLWASGSIYGKRQPSAVPPLMAAAMQMLVAGFILCGIGLAAGELSRWTWTLSGSGALAYLIVFGSTTYAVYIWLLHTVTPAQLGTYAYANPVVAVALGWWVLGETLSIGQGLGILIILAGVLLVSTAKPAA